MTSRPFVMAPPNNIDVHMDCSGYESEERVKNGDSDDDDSEEHSLGRSLAYLVHLLAIALMRQTQKLKQESTHSPTPNP